MYYVLVVGSRTIIGKVVKVCHSPYYVEYMETTTAKVSVEGEEEGRHSVVRR